MPDSGLFASNSNQSKLTGQALSQGFRQVKDAFENRNPLVNLASYVAGQGALSVGDNTGTLSLAPGGAFSLRSPEGFSVIGNSSAKSLGLSVPVGRGAGKGTIGLQGSWGKDQSIQANFQFGQSTQPNEGDLNRAVNSVNAALPNDNLGLDRNEPTARAFLNKMIDEYRSTGGRTPDNPSSWQN